VSTIEVMPAAAYGPPPLADGVAPAIEPIPTGTNLGRDKLPEWTPALWERIDKEVRCELDRACLVMRFLPVVTSLSPNERTVAADEIARNNGVLSIDQQNVLALIEESQSFLLSKEQYHDEDTLGTAVTLATHAANSLAQAVDSAVLGSILQAAENGDEDQILKVPPLEGGDGYGENAASAVGEAYARLQGKQKYGRYAAIFSAPEFGDAHTALATPVVIPADRIRPLMAAGFYGTGQLPDKRGLVVAVDGENADVAMAVHGATAFVDIEGDEARRFRVYTRFTGRIKDKRAAIVLEFQ
jgi:uncharacterized linocin/CFP29 family protein